jgi:hypothetical protein
MTVGLYLGHEDNCVRIRPPNGIEMKLARMLVEGGAPDQPWETWLMLLHLPKLLTC